MAALEKILVGFAAWTARPDWTLGALASLLGGAVAISVRYTLS
jgi:hypothetical protein